MAKLRDLLQEEVADSRKAAEGAAQGRSMTGLSGRHTLFGDPVKPIVGERISPTVMSPIGEAVAGDFAAPVRRGAIKEREPFGTAEQVLAWPPRAGYRQYWFNDMPGRIARAKRAGYEHVQDPQVGGNVSRVTDKADGRGRSSYLMEIPEQWYQDDMRRNAVRLAERLDQIKRGQAGPGAEDNRYIPSGGIHIEGR